MRIRKELTGFIIIYYILYTCIVVFHIKNLIKIKKYIFRMFLFVYLNLLVPEIKEGKYLNSETKLGNRSHFCACMCLHFHCDQEQWQIRQIRPVTHGGETFTKSVCSFNFKA